MSASSNQQPTPRVAILSAVETSRRGFLDHRRRRALQDGRARQITVGMLEGPLAFDNAIEPEAARIKGVNSPAGGRRLSAGGQRL